MKGKILTLAAAAAVAILPACAAASEAYTAQRRPRVTVGEFKDANAKSPDAQLASSVESMLETSLKTNSQLLLVERQSLGPLLEELQRRQKGMVDIPAGETASHPLLERVDAYIEGTVTVLDEPSGQDAAGRAAGKSRSDIASQRVEIDAKLLSIHGGGILGAAQRGGPRSCLRSIVERLGVALERDFLRPYYGKLRLDLSQPENVQIFLTPILADTGRIEERSPVERGSTVTIGSEHDTVESWITDPTTYTIEDLLGGWYLLRLVRPGYEEIKADPARWEVRSRLGTPEVYDRVTKQPLSRLDPELRRFVVHVDPLAIEDIDGDALGFTLRKQGGSLAPRVKRQYLDDDFSRVPQSVLLMGGERLHINGLKEPEMISDSPECDLFDERRPAPPEFVRTHVTSGQTFDLDQFKGGELIIDDYRGEIVPAGQYEIVLWDPNYRYERRTILVRDGDQRKEARVPLTRETVTLTLEATGARPGNKVILKGRETRRPFELPLDFTATKEERSVPVDLYTASTDIPGLNGWRQNIDLLLSNFPPPKYYPSSPYSPRIDRASEEQRRPNQDPNLTVKTRLAVAGRLDVLSRLPRDPAGVFIDHEVPRILDLLLRNQEVSRERDKRCELLARRLKVIDLLVLDPRDMARLRGLPEVAAVIRRFVEEGGALFAFITEAGDYEEAVGAPLVTGVVGHPTDRFNLTPGDVGDVVSRQVKGEDLPSRRILPELSGSVTKAPWRVIAFTEGRKGPRIVERGEKGSGGYVALWLDDPGSFRGPRGERRPKVEESRARVEERVLAWARYLMYRRYDKGGEQRRRAEVALTQ